MSGHLAIFVKRFYYIRFDMVEFSALCGAHDGTDCT